MTRVLALALSAIAALQLLAMPITGANARPLEITARPVPLNYTAPEQLRMGRLVWRGGIDLGSPSIRFGGFSGLLVTSDRSKLTALNDEGYWITATITYDADGFLTGLSNGQASPLRDTNGKPLRGKTDQDAEAMAETADGAILVAFERNHRIWRYPPGEAPLSGNAEPLPAPDGLADLPENNGVEAMATLAGDSILAIAEGEDDDTVTPAFLWRDGTWSRLRYQRFGNYRPADAARLPTGDLLVVERRYTVLEGVGIRIVRIPASTIVPGALLQPVEIARLLPPLSIDNIEGISIRQNDRGETIIYLISDDNFNIVQRTLLLMFALEE
ncbi:MAG TPA: esterase-like activity of phytase family protein [Kiloniellales bacterium]